MDSTSADSDQTITNGVNAIKDISPGNDGGVVKAIIKEGSGK